MEEQIEPAVRKIEGYVEGFFWILPNLGIGAVVLTLFLLVAWAAKRGVTGLLRRRGRGDLGRLLGDLGLSTAA